MPFEHISGDSVAKVKTYKEIDPMELRRVVALDSETGRMFWRKRPLDSFKSARAGRSWNTKYAGKEIAGNVNTSGYIGITIWDARFLAHRVAWAIHYGRPPCGNIDHINGDRRDNSIGNLRDVSQQVNSKNSGLRSDNKSGISGIWDKKPKVWGARWLVVIGHGGGIGYQKTHKCLGDAVRDRNAQYRDRGYTQGHGIRASNIGGAN